MPTKVNTKVYKGKIELTKIRSEIKPNICESEIKSELPDELINVIKFLTVKIPIHPPKG